jgi:Tol biopolymer transport system component
MAYVEVLKNGRLLTRRRVDEQKAKSGCRVRLGSVGEVRVVLDQPETLGDFEVRVFEGEPPEARQQDQRTASMMPGDATTGSVAQASRISEYPDIEGYKIIEPLGEGGMGIVWRAEQLSTRREVALKLLISQRVDSVKAQARFQREVELTARLDHPNIARIYDSGLHQGMYYYAMELIEGIPLDQYVRNQNFSRTQILALMQKVCQAVLYAHLRAVIHRDLKPSNIIISPDGQPHILDFGLAKALLDEDEELTISVEGQIAGTPAYMSPEQASGYRSQLDTRTDVYSLGVILFELLTGQSPHDLSFSMFDLLRQISSGNIRRPSEVDKSIDGELEAILLKALAHNPEERYASAGALAKDISNYLDEEPLDARVPTTLYFLRKKAYKYKKQVGITAAVLVVILVTFITAYTRIVGQRAVIRAAQERNQSLEAELADLRTKILSGNQQEAKAALAVLEEKYLAAQKRADKLQRKLDDVAEPARVKESDTGFFFGAPVNLGEPVNTLSLDAAPTFSNDGLEMYICSNREGSYGTDHNEDIWVARRATKQDSWGSPENLGETVNSSSREYMPFLSPDGLELYFSSDRNGGYGNCDLYMIERYTNDGPWSEPKNIGPVINSRREESDPTISADGLVLYFSSNRDGGHGNNDIWYSKRATKQDVWRQPINLGPVINTSSQEVMPYISSDGLMLMFASNRPGGFGGRDIYVSRRTSLNQSWSEPVNLGPVVNSNKNDDLPFISPDGSALYLNSERSGGFGSYDIWQVPVVSVRDFTFGNPFNLGSIINSSTHDRGPTISSDELELYFDSNRSGGSGDIDIWLSPRKSILEPWGEPENLGSIVNSNSLDAQPYISGDGLSLFFHSNRTGGFGQDDIWVTTRTAIDDNWTIPKNLGSIINTSSHEGSPCISEDGLTLYFSSTRTDGYGSMDLWFVKRPTIDGPWSEPINFGPMVNTEFDEGFPRTSADGLFLYFNSDRPGGYGKSDIWLTRRANISASWGIPVNLGPSVNSASDEGVPCISKTGSTLIFCSDRSGGSGANDLWQVPILTDRGFTTGNPESLGTSVNTLYSEVGPSVSFNGLSLYFSDYPSDVRVGGSGGADLWVTSRSSKRGDWGVPENLGPNVNSKADDMEPSISKDELSLYFCSNRPGGNGERDIWMTRRITKQSSWQEPINLGPIVNSSSDEAEPCISADELSLYFNTNRPGGNGTQDIWVTTRSTIEEQWSYSENLGSIVNSSFLECGPDVSESGLALLFCSDRPGALRPTDLWISVRSSVFEPWGIPFNIGSMFDTPGQRACANISSDGTTLFFAVRDIENISNHDVWQVPIIPKVDINGDTTIDIKDIEMVMKNWGQGRSYADIAPLPFGDGRVDKQDIKLLMDYWQLKGIDTKLLEYLTKNETQELICIEAEAADSITPPMKVFSDSQNASGGFYIGTEDEIGGTLDNPPKDGIASYNFSVTGGIYKILFRVIAVGDNDSFWVRTPSAVSYDPGIDDNGWIMFNLIQQGTFWHWDEVQSTTFGNQIIKVTLPAGRNELQIAYREDGALLDTIVITKIEEKR